MSSGRQCSVRQLTFKAAFYVQWPWQCHLKSDTLGCSYELGSAVQRPAGAERKQRQPAEGISLPEAEPSASRTAELLEQLAQRLAQVELTNEHLLSDMLNVRHFRRIEVLNVSIA